MKEATELTHGDDSGVGAVWRLEWRTAYTLTLPTCHYDARRPTAQPGGGRFRRASRHRALRQLTSPGAEGRETLVRYDWNVGTDKAWMNALAPVARPLFEWNHNVSWPKADGVWRATSAPSCSTPSRSHTPPLPPPSLRPAAPRGQHPVGCRRPGLPERPARSPLTHAAKPNPSTPTTTGDLPGRSSRRLSPATVLRQGCAAPPGLVAASPASITRRKAPGSSLVGIPGTARRTVSSGRVAF